MKLLMKTPLVIGALLSVLIGNPIIGLKAESVNDGFVFLEEPCRALVKDIFSSEDKSELVCLTSSGMNYNVPLVDTEWIREKIKTGELRSGKTFIDLPADTLIDMQTQTLQLTSPPKLINKGNVFDNDTIRRRKLATTTGTKTVLVVRVDSLDGETSQSESQLADNVFGITGDPVNVKSQYSACSHERLNFIPKPETVNGVITVNILSAVNGVSDMLNKINEALEEQFQVSSDELWDGQVADLLMYCLSPGILDGIAFAYLDTPISVYNDDWCASVSTQMHEIGHNLNMGHSGVGSDEYADKSGMMGYSYWDDDAPKMCFNAAKTWQLGWFAEKAITFTPLANHNYAYFGKLGNFVDFSTDPEGENVLIKISQPNRNEDYYLNYNAAKGFNDGVQDGRNKVLITSKDRRNDSNMSIRQTAMVAGESFVLTNFNNINGETLTIQVEEIDYSTGIADLSIVLTGPSVPVVTTSPSSSPTTLVSAEPSLRPSNVMSMSPTTSSKPSAGPSDMPSVEPTASIQPSRTPTDLPSVGPTTSYPSESPSDYPSAQPTQNPSMSAKPSESPSFTPSQSPSREPSLKPTESGFPSLMPTREPSQKPSEGPSFIPTRSPSLRPSMFPSASPSISRSPDNSGSPSTQPSMSLMPSTLPTAKPSESPSFTPSQSPSLEPSLKPTESGFPSLMPTREPSQKPSERPSFIPTWNPSGVPTLAPTSSPSTKPTKSPTRMPSNSPSLSQNPTATPSSKPSPTPTQEPSQTPTAIATLKPTTQPSLRPSVAPTENPSHSPTYGPSTSPSQEPSTSPTPKPSNIPTQRPSNNPTAVPSLSPSFDPSSMPSLIPSFDPSSKPSSTPSFTRPSGSPTETEGLNAANAINSLPTYQVVLPSSGPSVSYLQCFILPTVWLLTSFFIL